MRFGVASLYVGAVLLSIQRTVGLTDAPSFAALLVALAPVAIFLAATRKMQPVAVTVLGVLLLGQAALYALAVPAYDDDAQGGLLFFFVPFWGAVGLGLALGAIAGVDALLQWRRRP